MWIFSIKVIVESIENLEYDKFKIGENLKIIDLFKKELNSSNFVEISTIIKRPFIDFKKYV